jgi:sugar (pentulose or hexulose) kinase
MRTNLFAALATMKIGLSIIFDQEHVVIKKIFGHGGFFKTKEVGQRIMAAALKVPVSVMETAGEGGPWGMAVLAAFMKFGASGETIDDFLSNRVFAGLEPITIAPDPDDVAGFEAFMKLYKEGLPIERKAVKVLK